MFSCLPLCSWGMQAAEIKVIYTPKLKTSECLVVRNSRDSANLAGKVIADMGYVAQREAFIVLLLNRSNRVLGWHLVSVGGLSATLVDPKIIFQVALKCNATGIIISHNHPSGDVRPSPEDIRMTKKIYEGGNLLVIKLLDHVIVTEGEEYYSFADEGNLNHRTGKLAKVLYLAKLCRLVMDFNLKNAIQKFHPSPSFEMIYFEAVANSLDAGASCIVLAP